MNSPATPTPRFVPIGLLVTGQGEEKFLPSFFRSLAAPGPEGCTSYFRVVARIPQLNPVTSERRVAKMVGKGQKIETLDEKIGLQARAFLQRSPDAFLILVDDLEHDRRHMFEAVYSRYRSALDTILVELHWRTSVHFLVNMLEAYYFADAKAINAALGLSLQDWPDDVERIQHPKNQLKQMAPGYREIEHGQKIVGRLDLEHILSRPDQCAALRTLVAWCTQALGREPTHRFQLLQGETHPVTGVQIRLLPPLNQPRNARG